MEVRGVRLCSVNMLMCLVWCDTVYFNICVFLACTRHIIQDANISNELSVTA